MGTRCVSVGRKDRQKENWATEDAMGRHVQESSRRTVVTNSQKPARKEYAHASFTLIVIVFVLYMYVYCICNCICIVYVRVLYL
jgi:hypothetical protein